jgi:hypothetical protein
MIIFEVCYRPSWLKGWLFRIVFWRCPVRISAVQRLPWLFLEVLTAVTMEDAVFWIITPRSSICLLNYGVTTPEYSYSLSWPRFLVIFPGPRPIPGSIHTYNRPQPLPSTSFQIHSLIILSFDAVVWAMVASLSKLAEVGVHIRALVGNLRIAMQFNVFTWSFIWPCRSCM